MGKILANRKLYHQLSSFRNQDFKHSEVDTQVFNHDAYNCITGLKVPECRLLHVECLHMMPNIIRPIEQEVVMYSKHLESSNKHYIFCIVDMMHI